MAYLKSESVKIFPFGSPRTSDFYGRVLNEQNLVRLIKSLVDIHSYVISYDTDTHKIVFVVGGYYCECDISDLITNKPLFVEITTTSQGEDDKIYTVLVGNDDSERNFTALTFLNEEPALKTNSYYLQLLDNNGKVPAKSFLKFNNTSIANNYTLIDCGSSESVI